MSLKSTIFRVVAERMQTSGSREKEGWYRCRHRPAGQHEPALRWVVWLCIPNGLAGLCRSVGAVCAGSALISWAVCSWFTKVGSQGPSPRKLPSDPLAFVCFLALHLPPSHVFVHQLRPLVLQWLPEGASLMSSTPLSHHEARLTL